MEPELTSEERALIERIAREAKPRYVRRARVLLAWDERHAIEEISAGAGLSSRRVRFWMRSFLERRLAVFPQKLVDAMQQPEELPSTPLPAALPVAEPPRDAIVQEEAAEPSSQGRALSIAEMIAQSGADLSHAQYVASLAVQLYDLVQEVHTLDTSWRRMLEAASLLHEVAMATDPAHYNRAGRLLILQDGLGGFAASERDLIGWIVFLQGDERAFARMAKAHGLSGKVRRGCMTAAAILRIADGLDCTRTQSSTIEGVRRVDEGLQIIVGGPDSARGALCARERGKLWRRVWGAPIYAESALPLSTGLLRMLEQPSRPRPAGPGIIPDEPMAEAGRKVLAFHLQRMLKHEPGTREGSDIEELHDMRVATRRLRAAFRVFGDYWKSSAATPLVDGLRATGRALGAVRDLDVLINKAHLYLDGFGEAESDLTPLFEAWGQLREERRQEMVAYLDSDDYKRFCIVLTDFSTTPGMGARSVEASDPVPYLVAHVAPFAIYHRWAQVMAFGAWLGQAPIATLHALRIHAKNLRYTLEFFEEVLGPDADKVIQRVVGLQDHLGSLQDASVAGDMVRDLINQWAEEEASRSAMERIDIHGVTGYLAAIQEQIHVLVEHMPDVWATLDSDSVRAKLAAAVSVL